MLVEQRTDVSGRSQHRIATVVACVRHRGRLVGEDTLQNVVRVVMNREVEESEGRSLLLYEEELNGEVGSLKVEARCDKGDVRGEPGRLESRPGSAGLAIRAVQGKESAKAWSATASREDINAQHTDLPTKWCGQR